MYNTLPIIDPIYDLVITNKGEKLIPPRKRKILELIITGKSRNDILELRPIEENKQ